MNELADLLAKHGIDKTDYFVAELDGRNCATIKDFLREIGVAFRFPDYYGQNMDAFLECINDLDWIDKPNFALVIWHTAAFLDREPEETKEAVRGYLARTRQEWANVPNYVGEEEFRKRAEFAVIYD